MNEHTCPSSVRKVVSSSTFRSRSTSFCRRRFWTVRHGALPARYIRKDFGQLMKREARALGRSDPLEIRDFARRPDSVSGGRALRPRHEPDSLTLADTVRPTQRRAQRSHSTGRRSRIAILKGLDHWRQTCCLCTGRRLSLLSTMAVPTGLCTFSCALPLLLQTNRRPVVA
jgi:hypothetical protein